MARRLGLSAAAQASKRVRRKKKLALSAFWSRKASEVVEESLKRADLICGLFRSSSNLKGELQAPMYDAASVITGALLSVKDRATSLEIDGLRKENEVLRRRVVELAEKMVRMRKDQETRFCQ